MTILVEVVLADPGRETRRGPDDHGPVHPVRSGPDGPPQPGGPELQPAREPVRQLGGRAAFDRLSDRLRNLRKAALFVKSKVLNS